MRRFDASEKPAGGHDEEAVLRCMSARRVDDLVWQDAAINLQLDRSAIQADAHVTQAVKFFKLVAVLAVFVETARKLECTTYASAARCYDVIFSIVDELIGIDSRSVVKECAEEALTTTATAPNDRNTGEQILSVQKARELVTSALSNTDFSFLVKRAQEAYRLTDADLLESLQTALVSFLRRTDPHLKTRVLALAEDYRSGNLTLSQMSSALRVPVPDVLLVLDQLGIGRSVEAMRMDNDARNSMLAKLPRFGCAGHGVAVRAAIASQRLEGLGLSGERGE